MCDYEVPWRAGAWVAVPHNSWKCWYRDLARLPFGFSLNWSWAAAAPTGPFLGLQHNPAPCTPSPAWGVPAVLCPTCLPFGPVWLHWDILPLPGPLSKTPWSLLRFGHSYTPSLGQEPGRARGQSQLLALHQCLHFPSNSDEQDGSAPGSGAVTLPLLGSRSRGCRPGQRVEGPC